MTRQEKRGLADLRAASRKRRLQKILAAKSKPKKHEEAETPGLVIAVGPGICTVTIEGETRQCRREFPVATGDTISIHREKVASVAPRRTLLSRADRANPNRERVDRKSTRLNSSHLVISYAVFC